MKKNQLTYYLIGLLAIVGMTHRLHAQEAPTFRTVDATTYHYFLDQKWDSLVAVGKTALKSDIDYYYLRIRLGIAYFNKGKYAKAIQHLQKATKFNSGDSTALEYMYYAYRSYNRPLYQSHIAKQLKGNARQRILKQFPLYRNSFSPEVGYQGDNKLAYVYNPSLGVLQFDLPQSYMFFGLDYKHYFGGIALNAAYEYFDSRRMKETVTPLSTIDEKYNVAEHHFYVNTEISSKNKLTIVPALQYQSLKYAKTSPLLNVTDSTYTFPLTNFSYNNIIASLAFNKDISTVSLGLAASFSRIYNKNIFQATGQVTWFPLGNLNLYSTTTLAYMIFPGASNGYKRAKGAVQQTIAATNGDKSHAVIEEAIGGKVTKNLWIEAQGAFNGLRGYNKANATVVFNNPEQVKYMVGLTGVYEVSKVLELTIGYQFSQKDITGTYYSLTTSTINHYTNNSNSIYAGLKWKL